MEAAWNLMQLERPPNATWRIEVQKFDSTSFVTAVDNVIKDLGSKETFHTEAAILSRLIYRMKSKFRNDKCMKSMSKVNRALLNYLSLSLEKEYKNLKSYVAVDDGYVTLPSRQMIEYVLVRTQGFAKLMLRTEEVASHCANFFKSRINSGHVWNISIVVYAVISRIWILSRYLIKKCRSWYDDLYRCSRAFKVVGVNWLPKSYQLPRDLKSWLGSSWIDEAMPSVPSDKRLKDTMFKLIAPREGGSDDDNEGFEEALEGSSASLSVKKKNVSSSESKHRAESVVPIDDTGESISRYSFNLQRSERDRLSVNTNGQRHLEATRQEEKKEEIRHERNERDTRMANKKTSCTGTKKRRKLVEKSNASLKTSVVRKTMTFDNVTTKADLIVLLKEESYSGLDKLRWNMIRNKSKRFVNELNACSGEKEELVLLKKAIRRIQRWIA